MAIAFNAATNVANATATSITITHTAAGANRYVVVFFMVKTNDTATGVTYDSVAMTQVQKEDNISNDSWAYQYALAAPSTTANANVVGSSSASVTLTMSCTSYTGAQQTTPPDAFNDLYETGSGSRTVSVTTVADNCWLVCSHTATSANPTSAVNGTLRTADLTTANIIDSNAALTPAGAFTIGFNWPSSDDHTISALSIAPAAVASASPSASPSQSPSASVSPSASPSASPSVSPSASPSQSPSASASPSVSPSASPSQSPSASVSPSTSPSVSPSESPSESPSVSPSESPSVSPSPSPVDTEWTERTKPSDCDWTARTGVTTTWVKRGETDEW